MISFRSLPPALATLVALAVVLATHLFPHHAHAADKGKVAAFVEVTGYDVVIESLQLGAMSGPGLVGDAPQAFGMQYTALARKVFDPAEMKARAIDILAAVLPDDLLGAGADFYASELGQKLVAVENASHMSDDANRQAEGERLVADMRANNLARLELFQRMVNAIGSDKTSERAIVEIGVRFLMAASAAGARDLGMSEAELRQRFTQAVREDADKRRERALAANAWTYRDISDADLADYASALETPEMKRLYEVLNATEYQVMIERYEVLGARLAELKPSTDL